MVCKSAYYNLCIIALIHHYVLTLPNWVTRTKMSWMLPQLVQLALPLVLNITKKHLDPNRSHFRQPKTKCHPLKTLPFGLTGVYNSSVRTPYMPQIPSSSSHSPFTFPALFSAFFTYNQQKSFGSPKRLFSLI